MNPVFSISVTSNVLSNLEAQLSRLGERVIDRVSETVSKFTSEWAEIARTRILAKKSDRSGRLTNIRTSATVIGDTITAGLHFDENLPYLFTQLKLHEKQAAMATLHNVYIPVGKAKGTGRKPSQFPNIFYLRSHDLIVQPAEKGQRGIIPLFKHKEQIKIERVDLSDLPKVFETRYMARIKTEMTKVIKEEFGGRKRG